MDSLKTVFIVGMLAATAYGVYVSINSDRQVISTPQAMDGWPSGAPKVGSDAKSQAPSLSFESPGEGTMPGEPPTMGISSAHEPAPAAGPLETRPFSGREALVRSPAQDISPSAATPLDRRSGAAVAVGHESVSPNHPSGAIRTSGYDTANRSTLAARPSPGISRPIPDEARPPFNEFIAAARQRLNRGEFVKIHEVLSSWYGEKRLTADESRQLTELLDQVAGTVVYSRAHHLEPAYRIRPGDTLDKIAEDHNVTSGLLAKINGIQDPGSLAPGEELKVVRGPFDATIDLDKLELTLSLQGRYAGRFAIGTGNDYPQLEGTYRVSEKMIGPTYHGPQGTIAAEAPDNPLGKRWIGLNGRIGIHGTNDPRNVGAVTGPGAICLGDRDIDDVFDILSVGSRVAIRR